MTASLLLDDSGRRDGDFREARRRSLRLAPRDRYDPTTRVAERAAGAPKWHFRREIGHGTPKTTVSTLRPWLTTPLTTPTSASSAPPRASRSSPSTTPTSATRCPTR